MRCFFEEEDFRPAWQAIQLFQTGDHLDNWESEEWLTATLRVEANNGTLTLAGPYGQASIPAQVERPGVLFLPIRHFVDTMANTWGETHLLLEATPEYVQTNHMRFSCAPWWSIALFDDPASAPQTWEPVEPAADPDDQDWDEQSDGEAFRDPGSAHAES